MFKPDQFANFGMGKSPRQARTPDPSQGAAVMAGMTSGRPPGSVGAPGFLETIHHANILAYGTPTPAPFPHLAQQAPQPLAMGGLAQGATLPQPLAMGGLSSPTYSTPPASFDPYTYGQDGNGGWLFYKAPQIAAPQPVVPTVGQSPTGGNGGTGGMGGSNGMGADGGNGTPSSTPSASAGTDDSSTHGNHSNNPGGFSSKGFLDGLRDFGLNTLGFLGPIGAVKTTLDAVTAPQNARISKTGLFDTVFDAVFGGAFENDPANSFEGAAFSRSVDLGYDPRAVQSELDRAVAGYDQGGGMGSNNSSSDPDGNGSTGTGNDGHGEGNGGHHARGGLVSPYGVRHPFAQGGLAQSGLIHGIGGGQDDRVPMTIPADSYVIPADVVSGLGDGNPEEGALRLRWAVGGGVPAMGGLSRPGVPVAVSPAEAVVSPDRVAALGGGSVDRGEKALDRFVRNVRKHKTSRGGKHPPKARPAQSYMR